MSDETEEGGGQGEIILYPMAEGGPRIKCRLVEESLWLTQRLMAELFDIKVPTVNEHLQNIYAEGELRSEATIRKFRIVRFEGSREVSRQVDHYNLEAVLAVGYRVRSPRGTAFRQWATERLSEYLVKGTDFSRSPRGERPGSPIQEGPWGISCPPLPANITPPAFRAFPRISRAESTPGIQEELARGMHGKTRKKSASILTDEQPEPHRLAPVWAHHHRRGFIGPARLCLSAREPLA